MKETFQPEINITVGHISEKQDEIIEDLSATKQLLFKIQIDNLSTKAAIFELIQQLKGIISRKLISTHMKWKGSKNTMHLSAPNIKNIFAYFSIIPKNKHKIDA